MDDSQLRRLQLTELRILKAIVNVCDKNDIQYYLTGGTLLGAARHKGFIPWDDDVDISMPVESYNRFIKCAQRELGGDYFLQTFETDNNWRSSYAKVRLNGTTMIEKGESKFHIHQGIWVDVFIIAGIRNRFDFQLKRRILNMSNNLHSDDYYKAINSYTYNMARGRVTLKDKIKKLVFMPIYRIPISARIKMSKVLNNIINKDGDSKYYTEIWSKMTNLFPAEVFNGEKTTLEFEGEEFQVPPKWKEYLEIEYGDYMKLPSVEERNQHSVEAIDLKKDYSHYMK